ncbi:MAG: hypothetical protein R3Y04_09305 [Rikenellaceae bacterium]
MDKIKLELDKVSLLNRFRREMNGAVVGAMRTNFALEGLQSYGVSTPTIRSICHEVVADHELAIYIFESKVRELKLAATYIDDVKRTTIGQILSWCESTQSNEILQSIVGLAAECSFSKNLFSSWAVNPTNSKFRPLALLLAGKLIKKGIKLEKQDLLNLLKSCHNNDINSAVFALNALHCNNEAMYNEIITDLSNDDNLTIKEILNFF